MPESTRWNARAELDVPGETGRLVQVFVVWMICLGFALILAAAKRPDVPLIDRGTKRQAVLEDRSQGARFWVAFLMGLLVPGTLTFVITHRRRRGGPHARGIVIDVTNDGEVRLWGRGYGQRVLLPGAEITERLVDVYAGRMGSWRQRRLVVDPQRGRALELATVANADDEGELAVYGGEGDCVEVSRDDYLALIELCQTLAVADSEEAASS